MEGRYDHTSLVLGSFNVCFPGKQFKDLVGIEELSLQTTLTDNTGAVYTKTVTTGLFLVTYMNKVNNALTYFAVISKMLT